MVSAPISTTSIAQNTAAVLMGSPPSLRRLELAGFHQGIFKYCTQYVQKGAKLQCAIQIICGSEIQWIPPGSSQGF